MPLATYNGQWQTVMEAPGGLLLSISYSNCSLSCTHKPNDCRLITGRLFPLLPFAQKKIWFFLQFTNPSLSAGVYTYESA